MCKLCTSTCIFSSSCETYSEFIPQTKITALQKLYSIKTSYNIITTFFQDVFIKCFGNMEAYVIVDEENNHFLTNITQMRDHEFESCQM